MIQYETSLNTKYLFMVEETINRILQLYIGLLRTTSNAYSIVLRLQRLYSSVTQWYNYFK